MAGNKEIQIKLEREYPIPNWTLLNYGTMITFDSIVGVVVHGMKLGRRERATSTEEKKKRKRRKMIGEEEVQLDLQDRDCRCRSWSHMSLPPLHAECPCRRLLHSGRPLRTTL